MCLMAKKSEAERRQAAMARKGITQPKLPGPLPSSIVVDRTNPVAALHQLNKNLAEHRDAVRKLERGQAAVWKALVSQGIMSWAQIAQHQGVTRQALQKQVRKYFPES